MLVTGLAALGVIAWAFAGTVGRGNAGPAAGGSGGTTAGAGPGAGPGSGAAGRPALALGGGRTSSDGRAARSSRRSAAGSAGGSSASQRPASPSRGAASAAGQINRCARRYVVLTLFASQNGGDSGGVPQFEVYVVSTEAQTCKFNVGARHLALVIKSHTARVWNSAVCASGQGSLITELQRGVPTVVPIVWDRQVSTPGCKGTPSLAPAGVYAATATDDGQASNAETFRLR